MASRPLPTRFLCARFARIHSRTEAPQQLSLSGVYGICRQRLSFGRGCSTLDWLITCAALIALGPETPDRSHSKLEEREAATADSAQPCAFKLASAVEPHAPQLSSTCSSRY